MFIRKFAIAAALAAFLVGCQTAAPPATASGKPEVMIKAQTAAIKARLISLAMDKRFNVTKDTEYLLQVEKPSDNFGAALLLGSKYDGIPAERWVFTFAPILVIPFASSRRRCTSPIRDLRSSASRP